jgi:hypothetical protein
MGKFPLAVASSLPGTYCAGSDFAALTPSAAAVVANYCRVTRFEVHREMTVTQLAFALISASAVDDPVDVGIYNAQGTRLVSSGSVLGKLTGGAGRRLVPITPTPLHPGQFYYFGLGVGTVGGAAAQLMGVSPNSASAGQLFGAAVGQFETDANNAVFPLPAVWTIGGASSLGWLGAALE